MSQNADAYMRKNMDQVRIENQGLKIQVQEKDIEQLELRGQIEALQKEVDQLKGDLEKANEENQREKLHEERDTLMKELMVDAAIDAVPGSNLEVELARLFMTYESELYSINEEIIQHFD